MLTLIITRKHANISDDETTLRGGRVTPPRVTRAFVGVVQHLSIF